MSSCLRLLPDPLRALFRSPHHGNPQASCPCSPPGDPGPAPLFQGVRDYFFLLLVDLLHDRKTRLLSGLFLLVFFLDNLPLQIRADFLGRGKLGPRGLQDLVRLLLQGIDDSMEFVSRISWMG